MSPAGVAAVEPDDVVILVLHPDAPQETPLARVLQRRHVEYQAAHFPQKFAAHVIEFVVLPVEAVVVNVNHLQETVGQVLHREGKEISNRGKDLFALSARFGERDQFHALRQIRAPQEIFIAVGHGAQG